MKNTLRQSSVDLSLALLLARRPADIEEIAQSTRLIKPEVQVRLQRLMEQGLVSEEPGPDGLPTYRAAIDRIDLAFEPTDDGIDNTLQMEKGIDRLRRDLMMLAAQGSETGVHLRTIGLRMSEQRYQAWLERLRKLEAEFGREEPDGGPFRFLTVSLYATPQ